MSRNPPSGTIDLDLSRFFLSTGYLRGGHRVEDRLVARMQDVVDDHFAGRIPPYRNNAKGEISRLDGLIDRDPVFLEALRSEPVLSVLKDILGPSIEVVRHRHNHATLNRIEDIPFRLHRDVQQWSRPVLSVFIYLEDANVGNGCTHVVPGSHLLPYAGAQSGDGAGNWADEHDEYRQLIGQELPVPMPRGGVFFLNSLAFHSVGLNATHETRKSIVFACHSYDELAEMDEDESRVLLCGQRRFRGNPVLPVSGSLLRGT